AVGVADGGVAADLGVFDADGSFLSVDDLGLGPAVLMPDVGLTGRLAAVLAGVGVRSRRGTVLTVATVTGTARRADELAGRWSPVAEAMEGHPVALAAARYSVPFAEVRAISNAVGRRDRTAWDLPAALLGLETVGAALVVWSG
ncbi:MAG: futalosine hydrolase, partial [Frankia sp.]